MVLRASAAAFLPGPGFRDLFPLSPDRDRTLYSTRVELVLGY